MYVPVYMHVYTSLCLHCFTEGVKRHASVETEDTKTSSQVFKMLVLKATLKSIEIELFKVTIINACVT